MADLNDLRDLCLKIANEHGFTDASIGEDFALMHSEISEALEDHRKGWKPTAVLYETPDGMSTAVHPTDLSGRPYKPCGIPIELADCVIRILHFCGKHGIDIERAVHEKIEYNRTRPYKHGKVL